MTSNETVGALPPPPGITPNFDNPESIAYRVIVAAVLGPVIATPLCFVRLYTRRYISQNPGLDDYTVVPALLFALSFSIITAYQTTNGLGNHMWDVPTYKFNTFMKIGDIASPICYNFATLFIKVSLCFFYLRLSPFNGFRIAVYTLMVISVVYSVLTAFGFAWVCQPMEKYWDLSITGGSCIDLNAFFLSIAGINAATDVALLALPFFLLKDLNMPVRQKIVAAMMFTTGSSVVVISLIRVYMVVQSMDGATTDATWGMVSNFLWLLAEMWMGIICTSFPALHKFIQRYRGKHEVRPGTETPSVRNANRRPGDAGLFSDSGYQSGGLEELELETGKSGVRIHGVRPSTSNKSLLTTASRSDD